MTTTLEYILSRWVLIALIAGNSRLLATTSTFQKSLEESVLDIRIESLKVENGDMEEALRLLRQKDPSRILIGFEKASRREGEEDKNISFELTDTTVRSVLDYLCALDPRYTYAVVSNRLINVFPNGIESDPNYLLNMVIRNFEFHGRELPHNLILKIGDLAPELREYLSMKAEEYARKTGRAVGGPGAIMSVEFSRAPRVSLKLQNVTVREILNAIALHSMKLANELPDRLPISWKYEFISDPNAPTGLGGYPKWSIFY